MKNETRMAVAANPKETAAASMDVPRSLSVVASPLAPAAAAGSDGGGVGAGSPGNGRDDLCPIPPLMLMPKRSWRAHVTSSCPFGTE